MAAGKRKSLISCPRPPTTAIFKGWMKTVWKRNKSKRMQGSSSPFTNLIRSFLLNLAHGRPELFLHPASSIDFRFINLILPSEIISTFRQRKAEREGAPPLLWRPQ